MLDFFYEKKELKMTLNLSKRLSSVADFVEKGSRLADVGSDHAYLPIALVQSGLINFALAGEVAVGPFNHAKAEVAKAGLSQKIQVRLADGLDLIQEGDQIDTVTICGMGGSLITDILKRGRNRLSGKESLILQPNVGEYGLRTYLQDQAYAIIDERLIYEQKHFYEIILARKLSYSPEYSPEELFFGPHLLKRQEDPVFQEKWKLEAEKRQRILDQMSQSSQVEPAKVDQVRQELGWIKERIKWPS